MMPSTAMAELEARAYLRLADLDEHAIRLLAAQTLLLGYVRQETMGTPHWLRVLDFLGALAPTLTMSLRKALNTAYHWTEGH